MKKQLLTLLAFTCLILFSATESKAVSVEGWDWKNVTTYDTENATYIVCKSTDGKKCWIQHIDLGIAQVLKIPENIHGVPVTRIGAYNTEVMESSEDETNVFGYKWGEYDFPQNNEDVEEIILPDSLEEILCATFSGLGNVKKVNTPHNLMSIESGAFRDCYKVKEFLLGAQMKNVDFTAFVGCDSLEKIQVSKENPHFTSKNKMILSKDEKELWSLASPVKKAKVPKTVQTIKNSALWVFQPKEIILPQKLANVENSALATWKRSVTFSIAKKNKTFKVKKGCLYNKKTGDLVAMNYKKGVLNIPSGVTCLREGTSLSGKGKIKKMLIPKTVKVMEGNWKGNAPCSMKLKVYFKGENPPKLIKGPSFALFYWAEHFAPKKYYKKYEKWMLANGLKYYILNGKML